MNDTDAPEVDEITLLALAEEMGLVIAEALLTPKQTDITPSTQKPAREKTFNLLT